MEAPKSQPANSSISESKGFSARASCASFAFVKALVKPAVNKDPYARYNQYLKSIDSEQEQSLLPLHELSRMIASLTPAIYRTKSKASLLGTNIEKQLLSSGRTL